jgi:hypothetical protein
LQQYLEETTMHDRQELCEKIIKLYPEIGACGIDVDVTYDIDKEVWVVDLKKDIHQLQHHLEISDADDCMEGKQCVALGLEIAQLKKNIEGRQF